LAKSDLWNCDDEHCEEVEEKHLLAKVMYDNLTWWGILMVGIEAMAGSRAGQRDGHRKRNVFIEVNLAA
jgi:hypothetical protein